MPGGIGGVMRGLGFAGAVLGATLLAAASRVKQPDQVRETRSRPEQGLHH
jgi:hypothetical protein